MALSFGYESTLHRVLEIPEIVELIFAFMDEKDNANNACVCKRWSDIALDLLWRSVNDFFRLVKLLAPLSTLDDSPPFYFHAFNRTLCPDDWKRFARYARRVRKLSFIEDRETRPHRTLGPLVFDEIARTRTTLNILPNLHTLEWKSHLRDRSRLSLLFMSENVKHLAIRVHQGEVYPPADLFKDIFERMPLLTHLDLSFDFPVREIEDDLTDLIQHLPKLKKLVVPLYCLTSKVVEVLSTLQNLGTIQFEFMEQQGEGDVQDVQKFSPSLREGAFPALWDLSLSSHLHDMTKFLSGSFSPTNLTSLYVHVLSVAKPSAVTNFLDAVAENCLLLTHLYIDSFVPIDSMIPEGTHSPGDRLTFDDLRPILKCIRLTAFELRWNLPLNISQDDIEELASKWPYLEILMLNCEPVPLGPDQLSSLTLRAVIPFVRHCPNLRELGLYVSATAADLDAVTAGPSSPLQPFRQLTRFCVGTSSISEPGPIALFLSQLLPLECEVVAGVSWPEGFSAFRARYQEDMQLRTTEWYDRWQEVGRVLPLLTRLRMEERENRKLMERELEDLRMRFKVLEERSALSLGADSSCLVL